MYLSALGSVKANVFISTDIGQDIGYITTTYLYIKQPTDASVGLYFKYQLALHIVGQS